MAYSYKTIDTTSSASFKTKDSTSSATFKDIASIDYILMESGDYLLLENNGRFYLVDKQADYTYKTKN